MEKLIAVLANSLSGKRRTDLLLSKIETFIKYRDGKLEIFVNDWPANLDKFTEAWIVGGDGTVNFFINKFSETQIPIAVIKAGTGNDFATELYGNCGIEEQLEIIYNAKPKRVDAGECNGSLFINSIGIGFDGEVAKSLVRKKFLTGHAGYLWAVIKKIFSYREKQFSICIDGKEHSRRLLLLMVANGTTAGGGFKISPLSDLTDQKLNLILADPLPLLKRIRYMPALEKGRHIGLPFIHHYLVSKLEIKSSELIYAHMDGELFSERLFSIKVLPAKFNFLY